MDHKENLLCNQEGAVLLSDKIKHLCEKHNLPLIAPFEEKYLKPASYRLRLGSKCRVNGEDRELSDERPTLEIPPHGMAVVSTYERVNIPCFLIARWNLKVKKVYTGLLWVGGPQVDPGYHGYLSAPIYNLSTKPVVLNYKEPLFTIDFVKTTSFDTSKCKVWETDRPTDSPESFKYLDSPPLKSGVKEDLDRMNGNLDSHGKKLNNFQSRIDTFQTITFTVLGIIVAALSFIGISKLGGLDIKQPTWWQIATWIILLLVILILTGCLGYAGIKSIRETRIEKIDEVIKSMVEDKKFKKLVIAYIILSSIMLIVLSIVVFGGLKIPWLN